MSEYYTTFYKIQSTPLTGNKPQTCTFLYEEKTCTLCL